jgi:DNA-binding transcriptional LysR family regulator
VLERHQIEAFLTLAQELHFGRAAQRLGVSTSRVSQTIRQLERKVGVPLFRRTSRRVQLTAVGRQLADDLGPAWAEVGSAVQRAVDAGRGLSGMLRVGFVGPAAGQLVARAGEAFRAAAPDCELTFREAPSLDVAGWLRTGAVDLALTVGSSEPTPADSEPTELARGPVLVREAIVVAVPATHPYARSDILTAADLGRTSVLRMRGMPLPADGEAGPSTPAEPVATLDEALTLVGLGRGVLPVGSHVQRYHPRPDVTYVPLRDSARLEWRLVWLPERGTARVRAFSAAADEVVGD